MNYRLDDAVAILRRTPAALRDLLLGLPRTGSAPTKDLAPGARTMSSAI